MASYSVKEVNLNFMDNKEYDKLCKMISDFEQYEHNYSELARLVGLADPSNLIDSFRKKNAVCLLLMYGKTPCGYAFILTNDNFKQKLANISKLYIEPEHQNQGLGHVFISEIEKYIAKNLHARVIGIQYLEGNSRAQHLYTKIGYRPVSHYLQKKI